MNRVFLIFLLLVLIISGIQAQDTKIAALTFDEFEEYLKYDNDTTYIINFWATWCKPCVEELPYFESVTMELSSKKVKVILVSLDDIDNMDKKVKPFLKDMDLRSKVLLLNDLNYNSWIDKVDATWSGSIPATLIYNKNYRGFFEQSFEYDELFKIINEKRIKS